MAWLICRLAHACQGGKEHRSQSTSTENQRGHWQSRTKLKKKKRIRIRQQERRHIIEKDPGNVSFPSGMAFPSC